MTWTRKPKYVTPVVIDTMEIGKSQNESGMHMMNTRYKEDNHWKEGQCFYQK